MYDWQRDTMTRLTFGGGFNGSPLWSPDSRYVAFSAQGKGLYWTRADGAGQPQPLTQSKDVQLPQSFTPDGKRLSFFGVGGIWTLAVDNDGAGLRPAKPELFLQSQFRVRDAAFSPDGRWLAYTSNESGMPQVYVRAFPDKGNQWQVSNGGGQFPIFSRNGRELLFEAPDNRIMVSAYTVKGEVFTTDKPRMWSNTALARPRAGFWNYDLAPDGKRIAALMFAEPESEQKPQSQVILLQNFFDEVRRRVPVSGK